MITRRALKCNKVPGLRGAGKSTCVRGAVIRKFVRRKEIIIRAK